MPDLDQIKQREQRVRDRGRRFAKGRSGNPAGRPRGCRDHVNRTARLLLAGDRAALRLCLEGIVAMLDQLEAHYPPPVKAVKGEG